MNRTSLLLLALLGAPAVLTAQRDGAPVRVTLVEEMRVGRPAPAFRLPYVTRDGFGPGNQPFDLARELGHVVVLVFRGESDPASEATRWAALQGTDTLFGTGVVLAGISAAPADTLGRLARDGGFGFKLLHDSAGRTARRLGLDGPATAVVVGRDGRVRYREDGLPAAVLLPTSNLAAAVRAAKEAP